MLKNWLIAAVSFFGAVLILITILKIVLINLTPGQYVKYGCCSYGYLTDEQVEKERMKINICPKVECKVQETPGYKLHTLFNQVDFHK